MTKKIWLEQSGPPGKIPVHQSNTARSSDWSINDLSVDRWARIHRRKKGKQAIPGSDGWSIGWDGAVYNALGKKCHTEKQNSQTRVYIPMEHAGGFKRVWRLVARLQLEANMIPYPHSGAVILYRDGNFDNLRLENLRFFGREGLPQRSNSRTIAYHRHLAGQAWGAEDKGASRKKMPLDIYAYFGNQVSNGYQAHNFDEGRQGNDYE